MEGKSKVVSSFYLFSVLSLLSLFLMFLDHFSRLAWLREGFEKVTNPVKWQISKSIRAFHFQASSVQESAILQAKIDYLEQENAALTVELKNLAYENEGLRKQLKVAQSPQVSLLPAKNLAVIGGTMMTDKGEKAQVKEGMIVVSGEILVGRVVQVTPLTSQVALPTQEGNKIKVKILPSQDKGTLRGSPEGRLILEEVLQKVKLVPEQLIVTSGEEGKYPPDLPIGKIEKVLKDDVQIYQKSQVKPLVDYQSLPVVMIRM